MPVQGTWETSQLQFLCPSQLDTQQQIQLQVFCYMTQIQSKAGICRVAEKSNGALKLPCKCGPTPSIKYQVSNQKQENRRLLCISNTDLALSSTSRPGELLWHCKTLLHFLIFFTWACSGMKYISWQQPLSLWTSQVTVVDFALLLARVLHDRQLSHYDMP